jgi:hypothetical protein
MTVEEVSWQALQGLQMCPHSPRLAVAAHNSDIVCSLGLAVGINAPSAHTNPEDRRTYGKLEEYYVKTRVEPSRTF